MKFRLICSFVKKEISALTSDTSLPRWASRHIENCEDCRLEAAVYEKMRSNLKVCSESEQDCKLTWRELRLSLPDRPRSVSNTSRQPVYIGVAVAAALALLLIFGRTPLQRRAIPVHNATIIANSTSGLADQTHLAQSHAPKVQVASSHEEKPKATARVAVRQIHRRHRFVKRNLRKSGPLVIPDVSKEIASSGQLVKPSEEVMAQQAAAVSSELGYKAGCLIVFTVDKFAEETQPAKCAEREQKIKSLLSPLLIKEVEPQSPVKKESSEKPRTAESLFV